uniref:Uncharacterized protein n=1 Tax=Anguilla anguilla TaxID=7936 RepID=A0A0E9VJY9_ANGAN
MIYRLPNFSKMTKNNQTKDRYRGPSTLSEVDYYRNTIFSSLCY